MPESAVSKSLSLIFAIALLYCVVQLLQIEIGPYQFFIYHTPALLLTRFAGVFRTVLVLLFTLILLFFTVEALPPGAYIEIGCFCLLLVSIHALVPSGKSEQRLLIGFSSLLILCFPIYAFALSFSRPEGLLFSAANAATFIIPAAFSLVLAEVLWHLHLSFLRKLGTDHELERDSLVTFLTVSCNGLVAFVFALFLVIWGNRWSEILSENFQTEADQLAYSQLMANRYEVSLAVERALLRGGETSGFHLDADTRFLFVFLKRDQRENADYSVLKNPRPESVWHEKSIEALQSQMRKFIYLMGMVSSEIDTASPVYLMVEDLAYPVYSFPSGEDSVVYAVDSRLQGAVVNLSDSNAINIRKISLSNYPLAVLEAADGDVISYDWLGGLVFSQNNNDGPTRLHTLSALSTDTQIAYKISDELKRKFALELPFEDTLIIQTGIFPKLQVMFRALVVMALFLVFALLVSSLFGLLLSRRIARPILAMAEGLSTDASQDSLSVSIFDSKDDFGRADTGLGYELFELQKRFNLRAEETQRVSSMLESSVLGYESLLSAMPIGVMEVDGDYQLRFRNEAIAEITGDSAEAAHRLRIKGEELFEASESASEYSLIIPNESPRQLLLLVVPRVDRLRGESGFWLLATDITSQKALDSQLLQTAKLATLGEMSTGMAHELNQPLNIIRLATNNMTNSISKGRANDESMMNRLQRIDSAVDRAATIIDHMRAFGRVAGEDFEPFSVSSAIAATSDLVHEPMKANGITLITDVDSQARVLGNKIQFEQVLINMINNARDAILSTGTAGRIDVGQILDAETVTVIIEDTGCGIPVEALPHIFEPFFTTKPVGKGTGLGGSISYGIIQDMQGSIWAENVVGGARISIRLPLVSDSVEHETG